MPKFGGDQVTIKPGIVFFLVLFVVPAAVRRHGVLFSVTENESLISCFFSLQ